MPESLSSWSGILDVVCIVAPFIVGAILGEHIGVVLERKAPQRFAALPQLGAALGTIAGGLVGVAIASSV